MFWCSGKHCFQYSYLKAVSVEDAFTRLHHLDHVYELIYDPVLIWE